MEGEAVVGSEGGQELDQEHFLLFLGVFLPRLVGGEVLLKVVPDDSLVGSFLSRRRIR